MRKFFLLMLILLVILAALTNFVLPNIVSNILKEQIVKSTAAQEVDVALSSSPNFKIAFGDIETIHGTADSGRIGDIDFKNLTADGEKIKLDVKELLFPNKDLSAQERTAKILKSAEKIELRGIIGEEDLQAYIMSKTDKLENVKLKITPEEVTVASQIRIMGRLADVDLAGNFFIENGDVYFRLTNLDVRNTIIRHIQLDKFWGDVRILESATLPINLKFDSVELREGEVLLTAVRKV